MSHFMKTSLILLVFLANFSQSKHINIAQDRQSTGCGYDACPSTIPGAINVHLVPHSHDDTGWKKTVDQYYTGLNDLIHLGCVECILDSVIPELEEDPARRFIQVEMAFFWRWWTRQSDSTKDIVRLLVNEGRLEFTGGGWSMNDEATVHYSSLIDNMSHGLRTMKTEFGKCAEPRVAWQIDPFGHSREQAQLFALFGYDGLFMARIDYRDKAQRKMSKTLQSIWDGSEYFGESSSIFTGVFTGHYNPPEGVAFCDYRFGNSDPVQDDPNLRGYNVNDTVDSFLTAIAEEAQNFITGDSHIMITMGADFTFMNAAQNYKEMDKLIYYVNERTSQSGVHALYSTPACYLNAINKETGITWPTKNDDFFPHASSKQSYWTGYYTSRPTYKYHERRANSLAQSAKKIGTFNSTLDKQSFDLLSEELGVAQHHDAITGTSKQLVDYDYHLRLYNAEREVRKSLAQIIFDEDTQLEEDLGCPLLNISVCEILEGQGHDQILMSVFNPLPRAASRVIRLPIESNYDYEITDDGGSIINPIYVPIRSEVLSIPGRSSPADKEAIFNLDNIPAMGYKIIHLNKISSITPTVTPTVEQSLPVNVGMKYYISEDDSTGQPSGAYIFHPTPAPPVQATITDIKRYDHSLGYDLHVQTNMNWTSFSVRHYNGQNDFIIEWLIGPIPVDDGQGKEAVMTYTASNIIIDSGFFWTDANGRQLVKRELNKRSSYNLTDAEEEPVASNYYPITSSIHIEDFVTGEQISIVTDRSLGGSRLLDSQIELMVHRRCLYDDHFGVDEALNEEAFGEGLVVIGQHRVMEGAGTDESPKWRRIAMNEGYMNHELLFKRTQLDSNAWLNDGTEKSFAGLARNLPENVNIMTLEKLTEDNEVLLRLEHIFEPGEDIILSTSVNIDLNGLFTSFQVLDAQEMALGGNVNITDVNRLHWNTLRYTDQHPKTHPMVPNGDEFDVKQGGLAFTLQPMQIRTFLLTVLYN